MRNYIGVVILIFIVISCETPQSMNQGSEGTAFISLDSILSAQSAVLIGKQVNKEVIIKEQIESSVILIDSSFIKNEWSFASTFELNKPGFVGAIETIRGDNQIIYQPKEGESLLVDFLSVEFDGAGNISAISGAYTDNQADIIYGSKRSFRFMLEEGIISAYQIKGFQKIILRDTVSFEVKGVLQ